MKTVAFHTIGCKLNFAESSAIARKFKNKGYIISNFGSKADIYVINTCSVTSSAEKKCRQAIRQARKRNPDAIIAVIGCYSELRYDEIENLKLVDIILGNSNKYDLLDYIESTANNDEIDRVANFEKFCPAISYDERTRSFLKIQDGCDYYCTYCTVPFARGMSRSASIQEILNMINLAVDNGIKEIVLTGVNVGDFGKKNGESLARLLIQIEEITKLERLRISSIEPDLLSKELINIISNSDIIAPHFHISMQSGSDNILRLMNRKYDTAFFSEKINMIKENMPDAFIAIDVITGFPGETDKEFNITKKYIQNLPVSELHVFTYSERPGTKAANMPGYVQNGIRQERTAELLEISKQKKKNFYISSLNSFHKVLWEAKQYKGFMSGYTENYLKVKCDYDETKINTVQKVLLTQTDEDGTFRCFIDE